MWEKIEGETVKIELLSTSKRTRPLSNTLEVWRVYKVTTREILSKVKKSISNSVMALFDKFCMEECEVFKQAEVCPVDMQNCHVYRRAITKRTKHIWRKGTKNKRYPEHSVTIVKSKRFLHCGECNKTIIPNEDYAILSEQEGLRRYNPELCITCISVLHPEEVWGSNNPATYFVRLEEVERYCPKLRKP